MFRLWHSGAELPYERFDFPDGQPHVKIPPADYFHYIINGPIRTPHDLVELYLIQDVLRHRRTTLQLFITYLMGGRMDRAISPEEPFTLQVIADMLRPILDGFEKVTLFDPHSDVSAALLDAEVQLPYDQVHLALNESEADCVIIPDAGAAKRVHKLCEGYDTVQGLKLRDVTTGRLSGFVVHGDVEGKVCLIVDDLIDGGRTFTGIAEQAKKAGAKYVGLYATHGLFTKGWDIPGVNHIWTTDSTGIVVPSDQTHITQMAI